jgi:hypothetical protein
VSIAQPSKTKPTPVFDVREHEHEDVLARVERRGQWRINSAVWIGLEAAATIRGVKKPEWFQSATWTDEGRRPQLSEVEQFAVPGEEVAVDVPAGN